MKSTIVLSVARGSRRIMRWPRLAFYGRTRGALRNTSSYAPARRLWGPGCVATAALAACLLAALPGGTQEQHTHEWVTGPAISGGVNLYDPQTGDSAVHIRRGYIVDVSPTSAYDSDECVNPGCPEPSGQKLDLSVDIVAWSDNGFGGEFGYVENGLFVPCASTDVDRITCYKTRDDLSGIVTISLTYDDVNTQMANDPPSAATAEFTCWEYTISPCPSGWIPAPSVSNGDFSSPDSPGSFIALITPEFDHMGNSMEDFQSWFLFPSDEPGWCMNNVGDLLYPNGGIRKDAAFRPSTNGYYTLNETEDLASFTVERTYTTVPVDNYDFGTHGVMGAEFSLGPARLEGTLNIYGSEFPIDADDNSIADADSRNGGAAMDDEEGGPGSAGDGLTRYEEYRGFLVKGVHDRLDPDVKELFIYDPDFLHPISNFDQAAAPITVFTIRPEEFGGVDTRIVNIRHGSFHKVDQHGIWLVKATLGERRYWGNAQAVGPPGAYPRIQVQVDREQIEEDMLADMPPGATMSHAANVLRMVITHELGHGVAVSHHSPETSGGDPGCAMRYVFDDIDAAMDDAAEWDALEFGYLFCTSPSPDYCRSKVKVDDSD